MTSDELHEACMKELSKFHNNKPIEDILPEQAFDFIAGFVTCWHVHNEKKESK